MSKKPIAQDIINHIKNGLRETKDHIYCKKFDLTNKIEATSNLGYHIDNIYYFVNRMSWPLKEYYTKYWGGDFNKSGPIILFTTEDDVSNLNSINCIAQNEYGYKAIFSFNNIKILDIISKNKYIAMCTLIPWRVFE